MSSHASRDDAAGDTPNEMPSGARGDTSRSATSGDASGRTPGHDASRDADAATAAAPSLTLAEYQRAAARTLNPRLTPGERLLDAAAGLAEEAGEVLGLVRKHLFMRHELDRARLAAELGDALWCLTTTAGAVGLSLDEVAAANLEKLRRRYPGGYSDEASARRPHPESDPR